jgi:hypothetical protein
MKQADMRQKVREGGWVDRLKAIAAETLGRIVSRPDTGRIDSLDRVFHFARTRSAMMTQKKLYGYLKERIGIRYPEEFARPDFAKSIRVATGHIYAAALADLTVFCIANGLSDERFGDKARRQAAVRCYEQGLAENAGGDEMAMSRRDWAASFGERVARTIWRPGEGGWHFSESPAALIRWAPIADELKKLDREIVENSLRFAWIEVRSDFLARVDSASIAAAGDPPV